MAIAVEINCLSDGHPVRGQEIAREPITVPGASSPSSNVAHHNMQIKILGTCGPLGVDGVDDGSLLFGVAAGTSLPPGQIPVVLTTIAKA